MFDDAYDAGESAPPQPLPIRASLGEASAYPLSAFPPKVKEAIEAIVDIAQVPVALAAQSVLAACALCAQSRINVRLATRQVVPVSLFLFSVASSGDRKSTSDRLALQAVRDHEANLYANYQRDLLAFEIDDAAHKASMTKAKSGSKTKNQIRDDMAANGRPPVAPAVPMLTTDEATMPGLQRAFAECLPTLGLFSDEGAAWLGGYSMQDEHQAATGAALSKLWDGQPIKRVRANRDEPMQILRGRRLSLHLMVQPGVASKLFGNKGVRDQGLLSRMLVAFPKSMKGERFWKDPTPESLAALDAYHVRMGKRFIKELQFRPDTNRELDLELIDLTDEARATIIAFSDECERHLKPGAAYEDISDFASKMPENATRIAAVLAHFQNEDALRSDGLSDQAIRAGIAIVKFYAGEAARLYGAGAVDDDTDNAEALIEWIRKNGWPHVGMRHLSQFAPKQVRPATILKRAVDLLVEHGHLKKVAGGMTLEFSGKSKLYREAYAVIPLDVE